MNITVIDRIDTQRNEEQAERQPIDRTSEVLIDNGTSFYELLGILENRPEAVRAEKIEIEEKLKEEKEEQMRRVYGEDYELICDSVGNQSGALSKEKRRPGAAQLRKFELRVAMMQIGNGGSCEVYANGYAVYDNGDRKTVLWVPDCGSATYYFTPLKASEKMYLKQKDDIKEDVFGPKPWYLAVTVAGEDSIERNLVHPKAKGSSSDNDDLAEWDYLPDWRCVGGTHFVTPEEYVLRKEAEMERRTMLTDKQKKVYGLYYEQGLTQEEIASIMGIRQHAVHYHLEAIKKKFEKSTNNN